jgi:hypothetical protein
MHDRFERRDRRVLRRLTRSVSFALVLGLAFFGSQFLGRSTPAFADAPVPATCLSSGTADTVTLAGQQATLSVAEDPSSHFSGDLYLNGVACTGETGTVKSVTFVWAPPAGVSGQKVVFDESAAVFPCVTLSGQVGPASPDSTDVVAVDDANGGAVTVGSDGLSLASSCAAQPLSDVGSWSLVGNGADTLSAQGTNDTNQATQPVDIQLGGSTGGTEKIGATAGSTLDFSHVPQPQGGCSSTCALRINSSTSPQGPMASDTAQFTWGSYDYAYDFSAGAPSISNFVPVTGSPLTFYGQSAANYSFGAPLPATSQVFAGAGVETFTLQSSGSVTFVAGPGTDTFNVGGTVGSDTFDVGSGTSTFFDTGPGDTVDFTNVPTSSNTPLQVNAASGQATVSTSTTTFVNHSGSNGASDFTAFKGSAQGNTAFVASPSGGETFTASGSNDSIDFSAASSGVTVDLHTYATSQTGTVTGLAAGTGSDPTADTIDGLSAVTGSAQGGNTFTAGDAGANGYRYSFTGNGNGNTFTGGNGAASFAGNGNANTFVAGTGNETILDSGGVGNTIDFSKLSDPAVVNLSGHQVGFTGNNTATTSSATYSFALGPASFVGSKGGTTFFAGGTQDSFSGQGLSGDTLSFANAPVSMSQLVVCQAATSPCTSAGTTLAGGVAAESFTGITTFVGLATGNTRFVADGSNGLTFTGSGNGNALDLSAAPKGRTIDFSTTPAGVSLPGVGKLESFSGISSVTGSSAGGTTFVAGSSAETFHNPGGSGDTIDFSHVSTSSAGHLVVNASGGPAKSQSNDTAVAGATTYTFTDGGSGFTSFDGANTGYTDFLASGTGGYSFAGAGSGNSLSFAAVGHGVSVDLGSGSACVSASESPCAAADTDSVSGVSDVIGSSAGHNTFTVGSGSLVMEDPGSGNTIDLSGLSVPAVVNVSGQQVGSTGNDTATTSTATYSFGSGQTSFVGSQGGTTFYAGGTQDSFTGHGLSGDTLSFANAPGSLSELLVCGAATSPCPSTGTTFAGGDETESFAGISTFVGLATGDTRFVADGSGGMAFDGLGSGNALDLSAAPTGVTVDLATVPGSVSLPGTAKPDSFSGIGDVTGSSAGGTTFVAGSSSERFHNPGGNDTIDFSQVTTSPSARLVVNTSGGTVNGQPDDTAAIGPTAYDFTDGGSGVTSFKGAGNTDFLASDTSGYSFAGSGSGDVLDVGGAGPNVTVSVPTGTVELASGSDQFSGISVFSSSGNATYVPGTAGGDTFHGAAGDVLDLGASGSGDSVSVPSGTITLPSGTDQFSGIMQFLGSTSGSTTVVAGSSNLDFTGRGPDGNELDLSHVSGGGTMWVNASSSPYTIPAGYAGAGTTVGPGTAIDPAVDTFTGVSVFAGSAFAGTHFIAGSSSGYTFSGSSLQAANNWLDLLLAGPGASVSIPTGKVSFGAGTDTISGIKNFVGSAQGGTTFVPATDSGSYTFLGLGVGNVLDLSAAPSGTTVTVTRAPAMSGQLSVPAPSSGSFSDSFTSIQSIKGHATVKSTTAVTALPASVPAGVVGSAYSVQLSGSGGTAPYGHWSIFNGALPPGLTLSSNGLLAGKPTTTGTFSFVVGLVDSNGPGMPGVISYTLKVNSAPAFTSAHSTTFHAGTAGTFKVTTRGAPAPAIKNVRFTGCTPSKLISPLSFADRGNGTATIHMRAKPAITGRFTLCLVASNKIGSPARQKFTLTVARPHH